MFSKGSRTSSVCSQPHSNGTGSSRNIFQSNLFLRDATGADSRRRASELKQIQDPQKQDARHLAVPGVENLGVYSPAPGVRFGGGAGGVTGGASGGVGCVAGGVSVGVGGVGVVGALSW